MCPWGRVAADCMVRAGVGLLTTLILSGCAWWPSASTARPQAELLDIRQLDRNGGETRYRLTLRLTNPGEKSLRISGISCHLHIDGVLAVQGFAGALAPLPPQGSTRLIMEARANLLGGLKLMTGLSGPAPRPYRLDLQLRRPWTLRPLAVSTNGEILLDD